MALSQDKKDRISKVIKNILDSRRVKFPSGIDYKNRNAPFHELILSAFDKQLSPIKVPTPYLVAIASWMHGLNTSLGTGFENLSHIISGGSKREFTENNNSTLKIKKSQAITIGNIIRELKAGHAPNLKNENERLFLFSKDEEEIDSLEFTVDNYIETVSLIEGIEFKSVRPNSGEGKGEKDKILHAKAAFKLIHPEKEVKYYMGFPFDPTSPTPTEYNKERFFNYLVEFKKFFSSDEVLIASELWDHLSGEKNTMEQIFEIISQTIKKSL